MYKIRIAPNILALVLTIFVISSLKSQINSTSFAPKVDFSVGVNTSTGLGAIADLNNDNKSEVLVAHNSSASVGQIAIFTNTTNQGVINTSSFSPAILLPALNNVLQLDATDIDGDGKADIVAAPFVGTNTATNFSVYRNTSVGSSISFTAPTHTAIPSCIAPMKLKDFDGDGKVDLAAGFWHLGQLRIYRNISTLGNISFDMVSPIIINVGIQPISLSCDDFNGDGKTDIAICNYGSNSIMIFENMSTIGATNFLTTAITVFTGSLPGRITTKDIDNDAKIDILVSNSNSSSIGIYKNTSISNNISFSAATTFTSLSNPLQLACSDFDADGIQDVVVGYNSSASISVWRNFGLNSTIDVNTLGNRKQFTTGGTVAESYVGDIDGDNKTDIVTVNRSNGTISVFKNQTKPSNGLIAYYPFNGNAGDSSGFENHGTVFSGVSNTTDRKNIANKAFAFNGTTNAYVNVPANVSLNTANLNNITISCWFKQNVATSLSRRLFSIQSAGSPAVNYDLAYYYPTKKLEYINWNGTSFAVQFFTADTFSLNTWHFVALVIDSTNTSKLYVNGVLQGTSTNTVVKPVNPILSIGRHLTGGWNFDGAIDEFRVYDKALTLAQINELRRDNPVYYSKATGNLSVLSTWGTNADGSGTAPLSFDSSNTTYNIVNNTSPTLGGNFRINGANSTLVFGDGTNAFNLAIGTNDTLRCDSMYIQNNITITNSGTLVCAKLDAANSSNVQYIRSTPQSMAAGSYGNLVVSSATKTLTGNTSIKGILGMLASIQCNNFSLTLGTSSANTGTLNRTSGTIIGRFTRWFANATNAGASGLFPVGTATKYTPYQLEFTSAPTTGGSITCEFISGNPGNNGLPQFDFTAGAVLIDKAAQDGVWRLTGSGVTGGSFNASITANNFMGVNSYADLRMIRRAQAGSWTLQGNATVNAGNNSAATVGRIGLTTIYGEYGIGGDVSQNPLPVKLTQFSADLLSDKQVLLKWQTVQEINANKFIVKRSTDKQNWTLVGEVNANKNSNRTINYELVDEAIKNGSGVVYYQLVQADLNGDEYVSPIVSLNLSKEMFSIIKVYPNPASDKINIEWAAFPISIYDVMGKLVMEVANEGDIDISHLEKGVYLISDKNSSTKLIKQ